MAEKSPALPAIIVELCEVAGPEAAWALVHAKGGQKVFIPAEVNQGHWLAILVGLDAARKITAHYRAGNSGHDLIIPMARHYHSKIALIKALESGASANAAAAASGMHIRSAYRARAALKLPSLFDLPESDGD